MSTEVLVTVVGATRRGDVCLDNTVPIATLLPDLGRHYGLPAQYRDVVLADDAGVALNPETSLEQAGVTHGSRLVLRPREVEAGPVAVCSRTFCPSATEPSIGCNGHSQPPPDGRSPRGCQLRQRARPLPHRSSSRYRPRRARSPAGSEHGRTPIISISWTSPSPGRNNVDAPPSRWSHRRAVSARRRSRRCWAH